MGPWHISKIPQPRISEGALVIQAGSKNLPGGSATGQRAVALGSKSIGAWQQCLVSNAGSARAAVTRVWCDFTVGSAEWLNGIGCDTICITTMCISFRVFSWLLFLVSVYVGQDVLL